MPDVLDITTPIFLLIGLGFAAVRFGLYARTALPPLGRFVITFCIPALLFQAISQRHLAEVANVGYLLAYAGGSLLALRNELTKSPGDTPIVFHFHHTQDVVLAGEQFRVDPTEQLQFDLKRYLGVGSVRLEDAAGVAAPSGMAMLG